MGAGRVILRAVQASARRTIVAWTLYDFANSAFASVVLSTVYPAYYANVVVGNAEGRGDFWWGAAVSTAMVIGALTSPPLGGVADHAGARKPFFVGFSVACIVVTALMATVGHGMAVWGWTPAVVGIVTYEAGSSTTTPTCRASRRRHAADALGRRDAQSVTRARSWPS